MDLTQRSFGMEEFDYEEPQFFSVTMDHQLACVNVHWVKAPVEGGKHGFHVEGLSQHLLRDDTGIRAIVRAIKNILDYGADTRLRTLCTALDAYREIVVRNREAAIPQKPGRQDARPKLHGEQGRRGSELVLEKAIAKNLRHSSVRRDVSVNGLATEQRTTKRDRHGAGTTRSVEMKTFSGALASESRRTSGNGGKSTYEVARQLRTGFHLTKSGGMEEPKRRTKPSRKLIESRESISGRHTMAPRSRHDL
jgi:hypothetical protein